MGMHIFDLNERLCDEAMRAIDEAAFEAFNRYGYSKEWIMDDANTERVELIKYGSFQYIGKVDGVVLFGIEAELFIDRFYIRVEDLVKKED